MVYSGQNKAFSEDKQTFFSKVSSKSKSGQILNTCDIDQQVQETDYSFILKNHQAIEREFNDLFAVLKKQKDNDKEAFWMYCYYCASLLEAFSKAYSQQAKEKEYQAIKDEIKARLNGDYQLAASEETFIKHLQDKFSTSLKNFIKTPFHLADVRDNVAFINVCRIYWLFCRLTLTQGLMVARDSKLIEQLDALLGTHTDVDKIISVFKAPIGVINYLSVGLFVARIFIDGGLLIKHTFFPSDLEKSEKTSAYDRFKHEIYKRHCNFANDFVWATVNFITNFPQITMISPTAAGIVTAVFLGFDVCMFLYKLSLAKNEYLIKKSQYLQEIKDLHAQDIDDGQKYEHIAVLQQQLIELEINWKTKESNFYFLATGAALLMIGFSASLIIASPLVIVGCFFMCQIGVAMYLSSGAYTQYKEKSLYLEQAQLTGTDLALVQKQYEIARNDFIFTMIKNTVIPSIMIATFAICWPAALVLTALYVGYELFHAYNQHADGQAAKQIELAAEDIDTGSLSLAY